MHECHKFIFIGFGFGSQIKRNYYQHCKCINMHKHINFFFPIEKQDETIIYTQIDSDFNKKIKHLNNFESLLIGLEIEFYKSIKMLMYCI